MLFSINYISLNETDSNLIDLLKKMLDKDPNCRITIKEILVSVLPLTFFF